MKTPRGAFKFDFNTMESQENSQPNNSISKEKEHATGSNKKEDCEKTNADSISAVELENMRREAEKVKHNSQKVN